MIRWTRSTRSVTRLLNILSSTFTTSLPIPLVMLSFTCLKTVFNELYASSLAVFYLCLTIILRFSKPTPSRSSCRNPSAQDVLCSPKPLDKQASYGTWDSSFAAHRMARSLVAPEIIKQPFHAPDPEVKVPGVCPSSKERKTRRVASPPGSPVKNVTKPKLTKSKYSFKRKRRSSQSPMPNFVEPPPKAQLPETVASIQDRIKSKRRSALRPMLLIQDPTIDLRPFLLPERVSQRISAEMEALSSAPLYPFQPPSESMHVGSQWKFNIPEIRVEEIQCEAMDAGSGAANLFNHGDYLETNYLMV